MPMSVESFGRLGAPALTLLGDMAAQAVQAGGLGLSQAAFISWALRELSVALCRGNASLCRSGAYVTTRAAGRSSRRGQRWVTSSAHLALSFETFLSSGAPTHLEAKRPVIQLNNMLAFNGAQQVTRISPCISTTSGCGHLPVTPGPQAHYRLC
jgi:hypothetical protein